MLHKKFRNNTYKVVSRVFRIKVSVFFCRVNSLSQCSTGSLITSQLTTRVTRISSGQSGPHKHRPIGWSRNTAFLSTVLKCKLYHGKWNCQASYLSSVEVGCRRLMSATFLTLLCFLCCGINTDTGPPLLSPWSFSSSLFSPLKGAQCWALLYFIWSLRHLKDGAELKGCSWCPPFTTAWFQW